MIDDGWFFLYSCPCVSVQLTKQNNERQQGCNACVDVITLHTLSCGGQAVLHRYLSLLFPTKDRALNESSMRESLSSPNVMTYLENMLLARTRNIFTGIQSSLGPKRIRSVENSGSLNSPTKTFSFVLLSQRLT
jgi:hypothetical protein